MSNSPISKQWVVGIDIGGTNTEFGIIDARGVIHYRGSIETNKHEKVENYITDLYAALFPLIEKAGGAGTVQGIGVGAPNGNYYTGAIEYAPNLKWQGVIPLAKLIQEKFGIPAALTNDANAAAVGEMTYGATKGMKHSIVITLGTGVGSGIIINGEVLYGDDGFAGELGHNIVVPDGRLHWATGFRGSLEAYTSATGVCLTAIELLAKDSNQPSLLRDYPENKLNSRIVHECAVKGDAIAIEVLRFTGEILGKALANFVMFSSPRAIVLFGGLCNAGDYILKPTQKYMEENLLPIFRNKVKLGFSELNAADAAILGASALGWELK